MENDKECLSREYHCHSRKDGSCLENKNNYCCTGPFSDENKNIMFRNMCITTNNVRVENDNLQEQILRSTVEIKKLEQKFKAAAKKYNDLVNLYNEVIEENEELKDRLSFVKLVNKPDSKFTIEFNGKPVEFKDNNELDINKK